MDKYTIIDKKEIRGKLESAGLSVFEIQNEPVDFFKNVKIHLKCEDPIDSVDDFIRFAKSINNPIIFMKNTEFYFNEWVYSDEEIKERAIDYIWELIELYECELEDDEKEDFISSNFSGLIESFLNENRNVSERFKSFYDNIDNPYYYSCHLFTYYNNVWVYTSWIDEKIEFPEDGWEEMFLSDHNDDIHDILMKHFTRKKTKEELAEERELERKQMELEREQRRKEWDQIREEERIKEENGIKLLEDLRKQIDGEDEEKIKSLTNAALRRMHAKELIEKGKEKYDGKAECSLRSVTDLLELRYRQLKTI